MADSFLCVYFMCDVKKMKLNSMQDFLCIKARRRQDIGRSFLTCGLQVRSLTMQRTNTKNSKQIFSEKNYAASIPISTFMRLWSIYLFPRSICLFSCGQYVDRSWEYMCKSLTDTWMWTLGLLPPIPEKEYINGIFVAVHIHIIMGTESIAPFGPKEKH